MATWPNWQEFEQELSRKVLGPSVANRACEWTVMGRDGNSVYVWAFCAAYQGAPDVTAGSVPAVLRVSGDGTEIDVQIPRDGSYYREDVRALFPPHVQAKIFDRTFEPILPGFEKHAKLRLKWSGLPPAGANESAPVGPNQAAANATVRIFSGRPDPAWTLTHRELQGLDRLLHPLRAAQCPPLPDRLGYRVVAVGLGMEPSGTLIAAEGLVQSGDAGLNANAIYLSDPERSVEWFLLGSAQANVSEDLKAVLVGLLQPVPTPSEP